MAIKLRGAEGAEKAKTKIAKKTRTPVKEAKRGPALDGASAAAVSGAPEKGGKARERAAKAAAVKAPSSKHAARPAVAKGDAKGATPKVAPAIAARRRRDDEPAIALTFAPAPLDAQTQAYFDKCVDKLGFVPNVLQAYAFDMVKLSAFSAMYNDLMLAPSGLSKLEREMIAVAVSSVNRCYYCLTAHGAAVRTLSGDPMLGEQLVMNYRAARLDPRMRAVLDFAVKLTERPQEVEEEDRAALRRAGLSERDIWDAAAVAAFFNMTNRLASATDMRPNENYHPQARTPA